MQDLIAIQNLSIVFQNTRDFRNKTVCKTRKVVTVGAKKQAIESVAKTAFQMQPTLVVAKQFKDRLSRVIDSTSFEIRDRDELAKIVAELPTVKLTKSDLEETRLGKLINDIRRNASPLDKELVKSLRGVVKIWRDLCEIKPVQNGNSIVDRSPSSLISPSSLSNEGSRHYNGQNGYVTVVNGKENASNQHPALLRVRNQHTPLTSPSKDATYLNCSISPKSVSNISPQGRKFNNLYSRSATASPRDSFAQQQINGHFENGNVKLSKGVSPTMRNSFKNIFNKNGATVSPANSTNMHTSSNSSSRNCSPALPFNGVGSGGGGSDGSNSNSISHTFPNGKLLSREVNDEDSIGSNSNFSACHLSRYGNSIDTETGVMLNSENSKSKAGRKRKIEPDTLRENLNSVLNSTGGRKAQSTHEILHNVMKNNPLSCQSSPVVNGFSAAKKPRMSNGNLAYLDENAVDNFDAVHRTQNGFPKCLPIPQIDADSDDDSLSDEVPYNFNKDDHSVDNELAELYAKLPKISSDDLDAVKDIHFDNGTDDALLQEISETSPPNGGDKIHEPVNVSMEDYNEDEYETFQYLEEYEEEALEEVEITDDEYHSAPEDSSQADNNLDKTIDESMPIQTTNCDQETLNDCSSNGEKIGSQTEPVIVYQSPISLEPEAWPSGVSPLTHEDLFNDLSPLDGTSSVVVSEIESPFLNNLIDVVEPSIVINEKEEISNKDANINTNVDCDDIKNDPITPMSDDVKMFSDKSDSVISPQDNDDYEDDEDDEEEDDDGPDEIDSEDAFSQKRLIEEVILPVKHTKKVTRKILKKKYRVKTGRTNIKRDIINKFANEKWPGMNGNYDDEGNWCSYGDMSYVKPLMNGEKVVKNDDLDEIFNTDFVVLPYTNCSW